MTKQGKNFQIVHGAYLKKKEYKLLIIESYLKLEDV